MGLGGRFALKIINSVFADFTDGIFENLWSLGIFLQA